MPVSFETSDATVKQFFSKFGQPVMAQAEAVLAKNIKIQLEFTKIKFSKAGKAALITLPTSPTAYLKGTASNLHVNQATKMLLDNLPVVIQKLGGLTSPQDHLGPLPGGANIPASAFHTKISVPQGQTSTFTATQQGAHPAAPKAVLPSQALLNVPVPLKDAKHLGQAVNGTTPGKTYRVIGIGPRARMAARLQGPRLSVRVEGALSPEEIDTLTKLQFKAGAGYFSSHFELGQVSAERVLGVLFFSDGLEITERIPKLKGASLV